MYIRFYSILNKQYNTIFIHLALKKIWPHFPCNMDNMANLNFEFLDILHYFEIFCKFL